MRRCKWHVRGPIGGLIRCQLHRNHPGQHWARLGIDPITWES